MSRSETMRNAKAAQNDEFYTLYEDIEKEMNAYIDFNKDVFKGKIILCPCDDPEWSNFTKYFVLNFKKLGLKKLICTSYAESKKVFKMSENISEIERNSPKFDSVKSINNGKIFILDEDVNNSGTIDFEDLKWDYLQGDGDFRSDEVTKIRNECDVIVTNPPFSLFREFLAWIIDGKKKFLLIGNVNCIAYKEVFPLLMNNEIWLGTGIGRWISGFIVPKGYKLYGTEARLGSKGERIVSTNSCLWLTNIDHGKRHTPLSLMTYKDNIKFSKHKEIRNIGYEKYDNYDAIDVPFSDAIPSDYDGIMGVPLTFMSKYCPEQFEIIGPAMGWTHSNMSDEWKSSVGYKDIKSNAGTKGYGVVNGVQKYHRILIKRKVGK